MNPTPDKPVIEYPCIWSYKIICTAGISVKEIITSVLGDRDFSLEPSRSSSSGKYESFDVSVVIMSDEDRIGVFDGLKKHPATKFVL